MFLAEAEGCIVTDSTTKGVRQRLSSKRNLRRGSAVVVKGPVKVAVKTLKGIEINKIVKRTRQSQSNLKEN